MVFGLPFRARERRSFISSLFIYPPACLLAGILAGNIFLH